MRRRDALWETAVRLLDGAMVAVVLLSLAVPAAAQDKVRRVGLLSNSTLVPAAGQPASWREGVLLALDENGYHAGLNLELVDRYSDGHVDRLPEPVELCLYRIAQEALSNVVKHSRGTTALVKVAMCGKVISLCVADDGIGFETGAAPAGIGLKIGRAHV